MLNRNHWEDQAETIGAFQHTTNPEVTVKKAIDHFLQEILLPTATLRLDYNFLEFASSPHKFFIGPVWMLKYCIFVCNTLSNAWELLDKQFLWMQEHFKESKGGFVLNGCKAL